MRRIGLDFDNTIICYDNVFLSSAKERGLLRSDFSGAKQQVRDAIRMLPDGEIAWQTLPGSAAHGLSPGSPRSCGAPGRPQTRFSSSAIRPNMVISIPKRSICVKRRWAG